jgi:hypothetical protein
MVNFVIVAEPNSSGWSVDLRADDGTSNEVDSEHGDEAHNGVHIVVDDDFIIGLEGTEFIPLSKGNRLPDDDKKLS